MIIVDAIITLVMFLYILGLLTFYGCQMVMTILVIKGYNLPSDVEDMINQSDDKPGTSSSIKTNLMGLVPIVNLIIGLDLLAILIQMMTLNKK